MTAQEAKKLINITDIVQSESAIAQTVGERKLIFEIKEENGPSLGLVALYDLKDLIANNPDLQNHYHIRNIDQIQWTAISLHPYFIKKKPTLVSQDTLNQESQLNFYILKDGQKTGPYDKFELIKKLKSKDLLLTDMVSYNGGLNWVKLHQVEDFDRQIAKHVDVLPGAPSKDFLKVNSSTSEKVSQEIAKMEVFKGLNYEKIINQAKKEKAQNVHGKDEVSTEASNSLYKWLFIFIGIGVLCSLYIIKTQLMSPFAPNTKKVGERTDMLRPIEMDPNSGQDSEWNGQKNSIDQNEVHDVRRDFKNKPSALLEDISRAPSKLYEKPGRAVKTRSKKSFIESAKFQDFKTEMDNEDPNYYYDESTAVELEPVKMLPRRGRLGKVPSSMQKISRDPDSLDSMDEIEAKESARAGNSAHLHDGNSGKEIGDEGPIPSGDPVFENEIP